MPKGIIKSSIFVLAKGKKTHKKSSI